MRFLLILALLFPGVAHAQTSPNVMGFQPPDCKPLMIRVARLAGKLHVKPTFKGGAIVIGCDNVNYDVFELIEAFVDRLDRAATPIPLPKPRPVEAPR